MESGEPFVIMPSLSGETLSSLLKRKLEIPDARRRPFIDHRSVLRRRCRPTPLRGRLRRCRR
jgi:hypothetical protein